MDMRFGMTATSQPIPGFMRRAAEEAYSEMKAVEKNFQRRPDNQLLKRLGIKPVIRRCNIIELPDDDSFQLQIKRADRPLESYATAGETERLNQFLALMVKSHKSN